MKEKVGEVFSISKDNTPVSGCTISKEVHGGENYITYFSLAKNTDISAEIYCYAANCGRRKQRFIFGVFSSPTAQSVRRRHDHGGTTARSHRPVSGHQTTWCFETGL